MRYNIALIIIATGNYHRFVEPLLNSARIHFVPFDNLTFFIFTDTQRDYGEDCVIIPTKHEAWPGPTLHRYKNISNSCNLFKPFDYLFYCDADMLFVDHVGHEILSNGLTAVAHPGFYSFNNGSWCNDIRSKAYTAFNCRSYYAAGGFQGGKKDAYLSACVKMAANITEDEGNGVIAQWHDESHWNKYISERPHLKLNPAYCMVEQEELRVKWKIDDIKPKLIALSKDHKTIRQ